ncbi:MULTISPECIES: energy transducer TonB family protein [unclassified Roseovarius]|uniref:energy transducer TonB family protein n=1 Tax=unclassified Roseovarius TaxID=2614913 RepID=UPI0027402625|nr:TonB family protein [Roseovarius sp. MMSF_3350]
MIASSRLVKTFAAAAALVLHGTVVAAVFQGEAIEIEGDAGGLEASIGNSFADMAAGVMTPDATEEAVEETPPEEVTSQDTPDEVTEEETPQETTQVTPEETVQDRPEDTTPEVAPQETAEPVEQAETAPMTPTETPVENMPEPVEAQPVEQAEITPNVPLVPVTPSETVPEESVQPTEPQQAEVLEPVDEAPSAVTRSLRPKPRSAEFEEAHKPEPPKAQPKRTEPKPQRTTQSQPKPQPKGNAQQNARTGTATGSQSTRQSASQGTGNSQASGNAAASNYPGKVMRKISRVPRPRVGSRGTAVVAFRIAGNGGLAGVSIARSSGSSALDQAAVRMIQRAAPFPPPPAGARTSFSINIKGS